MIEDNGILAAWCELGQTAETIDWSDLPEFSPLPGNDYVDIVGHSRRIAQTAGTPRHDDGLVKEIRVQVTRAGVTVSS